MAVRSYFNKTKIQGEYMILEILFRSEKCMSVTGIRKNFRATFSPHPTDTTNYSVPSTSNFFSSCLYCIYLFKLYDIPIIMLLTNKINKFCGEISNSRVILWVVYNCNVGARGT